MSLPVTLAWLAYCSLMILICGWRWNRPHTSLRPRYIPWMLLLLIHVAFAIVLLARLANLAGIVTGRS